MSDVKVSIIVPVYNHQDYISECLESIQNQTFRSWEAILMDDGSTDGSPDIISCFVEKDARFKYIRQDNLGILRLYETYNIALGLSRGNLIAVLEGDDKWPRDKLQLQVGAFSDSNVGLVWGDGVYFNNEGRYIFRSEGHLKKWGLEKCENSPIGSATLPFILDTGFFDMPTCCVMYRRSALLSIGGFYQPPGLKWLDKPTWILMSLRFKFKYVPEVLGYWRRHDTQITSTNSDRKSTIDYMSEDSETWKEILDHPYLNGMSQVVDLHRSLVKLYRVHKLNGYTFKYLSGVLALFVLNPVIFIKYIRCKY